MRSLLSCGCAEKRMILVSIYSYSSTGRETSSCMGRGVAEFMCTSISNVFPHRTTHLIVT